MAASNSATRDVGKRYVVENYIAFVEKLLDEGGFSNVYQVRAQDGCHYALKKITSDCQEDYEVYLQEINILRTLTLNNTPHCVKLIAAESYNEGKSHYTASTNTTNFYELYLLMELCNSSVLTLINSRSATHISEMEIMKIFSSTCLALYDLHSMAPPIIHRDIKIENILINSRGEYVLCDFGSAYVGSMKPTPDTRTSIEDNINKFTTVDYRSPEMVNLYLGHDISTKSDIWALGILLYKLCYRKTPFGDSKMAILSGKYEIPTTIKYSAGNINLINLLLQPNPTCRPSIAELLVTVFKFMGKLCPIPGLVNTKELDIFSSLPASGHSTKAEHSPTLTVKQETRTVTTSINARSRPNSTISIPKIHNTGILTPPPVPKSGQYRVHNSKTTRNSKIIRPSIDVIISTSAASTMLDQFGMTEFSPLTSKAKASSTDGIYTSSQHTYDLFGAKPFVMGDSKYTSYKPKTSLNAVNTTTTTNNNISNNNKFNNSSNNNNADMFGATPFLCLPTTHQKVVKSESIGTPFWAK